MKDVKFEDVKSLQRYYHVITLSAERGFSSNSLSQRVKLKLKERSEVNTGNILFTIERTNFISDVPYHISEQGNKDYSKTGDGKAPFMYDVFIISMETPAMLMIACPFLSLSKKIVSLLLEDKAFWQKTNFVRADINSLLKASNEQDILHYEYSCRFSRLGLALNGETGVKLVSLDGERPLDSPLYKDVFRPKVADNNCRLETCSLQGTVISESNTIPNSNSLIHIDSFGNYKLYIHAMGKSLYALPYLFSLLNDRELLRPINSSPLDRVPNG